MKLSQILAPIAAAAALAVVPTASNATVALTLSDGVNTVTVFDGLAGDANGAANVVTYIGSIGLWTINVSTGLGVGAVPGIPFGIDLNSVNSSAGAGTLTIKLTETGLIGGYGQTNVTGAIGGTTVGTVAYSFWEDNTNALFGTQNLVFSGATPNAGGNIVPFAATGASNLTLTDPFSLTLGVAITHGGAGSTSFDFSGAVPEPTSFALAGLALIGLGFASRRKA